MKMKKYHVLWGESIQYMNIMLSGTFVCHTPYFYSATHALTSVILEIRSFFAQNGVFALVGTT